MIIVEVFNFKTMNEEEKEKPKKKYKYTLKQYIFRQAIKKRKRLGLFKFKSAAHAYTYLYKVLHRKSGDKSNSMYNKMNKLYKELDFTKSYIRKSDAAVILKDDNRYFRSLDTMLKHGDIETFSVRHRAFVPLEDIEQEMLRRELCAYKDDLLYIKEEKNRNYKEAIKNSRAKDEVVIDILGKERSLGKFPRIHMKKVREAIKFLFKNQDIFDEKDREKVHPRYMRKLVTRFMNNRLGDDGIEKFIKTYKYK